MKRLGVWNGIVCGLLFVSTAIAGPKPAALSDGEIIGIYNQVNSFDVETALLAMTQAHSEKVRELAAMVATDHRGVRFSAAKLAAEIEAEVSLPAARQKAARDHYQVTADITDKTGEEFDRAYLLHEIRFHSDAMEAVKSVLLPAAKDKLLKQHFESVLPHFQHHLNETIKVAKELGYYKE